MTFSENIFIFFIIIFLVTYYIIPLRIRWCTVLLGSVVFYAYAGVDKLAFVLVTCFIGYVFVNYGGIDRYSRYKRKCTFVVSTILVICALVYVKIGSALTNYFSSKDGDFVHGIIIPLGISYYTFTLIGYMADVYWKKDNAEKNYFKLLLYMIYFPHILQGPIPRHKRLAPQLIEGHPFEYKRFCFGLQRMVWGYFKKLVIADRFAAMVREIYGNYELYEGQFFIVAILASSIQLYCDFSGCMDIALGISECLGITLDENFKRPFFSKNASEFWRRWHITLGTWFKDYVYMPLVINPKIIGISKKVRDRFGIRAGKNVMTIIPLSIVWLLTGLWHGTGLGYIIWGCYWGTIIIISTVLAPEIRGINIKLKIDTESPWWKYFQMIRTFILFCIGRLLTAPGDIKVTWYAIKSIFSTFNIWIWFDQSLYNVGLDRQDFWVGILGIILLWRVSILQEKGIRIRESVAKWPLPIRWMVYYGAIFAVIILGIYGPGYDASAFVYMNY